MAVAQRIGVIIDSSFDVGNIENRFKVTKKVLEILHRDFNNSVENNCFKQVMANYVVRIKNNLLGTKYAFLIKAFDTFSDRMAGNTEPSKNITALAKKIIGYDSTIKKAQPKRGLLFSAWNSGHKVAAWFIKNKKPDEASSSGEMYISRLSEEREKEIAYPIEEKPKVDFIENSEKELQDTKYQNYALPVISLKLDQIVPYLDFIDALKEENSAYYVENILSILEKLAEYHGCEDESNAGLHELDLCDKYKDIDGKADFNIFMRDLDDLKNLLEKGERYRDDKIFINCKMIHDNIRTWIVELEKGFSS